METRFRGTGEGRWVESDRSNYRRNKPCRLGYSKRWKLGRELGKGRKSQRRGIVTSIARRLIFFSFGTTIDTDVGSNLSVGEVSRRVFGGIDRENVDEGDRR